MISIRWCCGQAAQISQAAARAASPSGQRAKAKCRMARAVRAKAAGRGSRGAEEPVARPASRPRWRPPLSRISPRRPNPTEPRRPALGGDMLAALGAEPARRQVGEQDLRDVAQKLAGLGAHGAGGQGALPETGRDGSALPAAGASDRRALRLATSTRPSEPLGPRQLGEPSGRTPGQGPVRSALEKREGALERLSAYTVRALSRRRPGGPLVQQRGSAMRARLLAHRLASSTAGARLLHVIAAIR